VGEERAYYAERRDKGELDNSKSDRVTEGGKNGFRRSGREDGHCVPKTTESLSFVSQHAPNSFDFLRTTSFGETGAFSASATSTAFSTTLPLLSLIVLKASLKLFCLPRLVLGGHELVFDGRFRFGAGYHRCWSGTVVEGSAKLVTRGEVGERTSSWLKSGNLRMVLLVEVLTSEGRRKPDMVMWLWGRTSSSQIVGNKEGAAVVRLFKGR